MDILQLSHYLDNLLNINGIKDSSRAVNGLQVENTGEIRKIGLAVDACQATIDMAIAQECNMMFVHHGLFWGGLMPVRGAHYQKLAAMLGANLGLYSAHVPLDMHPVLGNNRALADIIGLKSLEPFGEYEGELIGLKGQVGGISAEALSDRLKAGLGSPVRVIGEGTVNTVGVVTGGAGDMLKQAIDQRLDAYITGEGANHHFHEALEGGCVFLLAGHYATETGGVRAVGRHLKDKFDIESVFLDFPTGL